ncbi:hypothetical protein JHW43_000017 [Diplocarpon mali]|nr:hypothetical protein JHW43_000017 [Diplocarpon mali]
MDLIRSASSALMGLLTSSCTPPRLEPLDSALTSFPQFSQLPIELRLKIWSYSASPRLLHLHLHGYNPAWYVGDQCFAGYASAITDGSVNVFDGPSFIPDPYQPGSELPGYIRHRPLPQHMTITSCISAHPCDCRYFPSKSWSALPPPAAFLACRESHDVLAKQFRRCLENEYNSQGHVVVNPVSRINISPPDIPPYTGVIFNPMVDTIHLRANVSSLSSVQEICRFTAIAVQQIPDIRRVVFDLEVSMPPYRFWGSPRFQYWEKWCPIGWWVPTQYLVQLKDLEQVFLVGKKGERMLPVDWKDRTERQWVVELLKVEDQWPIEWEGRIPSLKCVSTLEEA